MSHFPTLHYFWDDFSILPSHPHAGFLLTHAHIPSFVNPLSMLTSHNTPPPGNTTPYSVIPNTSIPSVLTLSYYVTHSIPHQPETFPFLPYPHRPNFGTFVPCTPHLRMPCALRHTMRRSVAAPANYQDRKSVV